jgi:hypothetical protein
MLKADGFDDAVIGTTMLWGKEGRVHGRALIEVLVYSAEACINILIERDGMDYEEAVEFFEFNVTGSYMGKQTPVFVWTDTEDLDL